MRELCKLKVYCPYKILKIEDIKISIKPNEHGYLYLKCLIDDSINFKYSIEASTEDKIILYEELEDKQKSIIFNGIIENIRTTNENGIYYLELEGGSSSSLLDIQRKTRSFQDSEMSYDDLINEILKDYTGLGFTQCMSRPMSIGKPLFQYKETDYEFLKRVATLLGLELICDIINWNNMFYFGRPEGKKYELEDEINYKACKDLERYYMARTRGFGVDFHDTDFFYYEVENRVKMDIGDKIYFKQKDLYVNQYEAKLYKGELIYKYRFCRKDGIWQDKIYNPKIRGISLEGKVLEAAGEMVKLHLNIDKSQDPSKAAWFYYAPPTGNILYSMPIVGESATLYFQDEIDTAPIVTGCVRKNGSTCESMSNIANRYFATESGNYLDMLPGAISFHRSGLNVNLNDKNGITLSSSGNLSIEASGSVSLSAGSVSINATSKLLVQKNKSSYISLENEFYAKASAVYENGSDRQSNPKFTDDEPTAGVAEAIAKQKAESMKFNNENLVAAILGGKALSLQSNPFDKSNQSYLVPTSKDSVPLQGNDLKNRVDIPEYNPAKVYKQDTIVKYKSLDGEYILGTAGVPKQGTNKIIFTPYDKESYTQHNSPADAGKSIALGVVDSGQKVVFGTFDLATYGWQGLNYGTGIVSDGYKNVFGVSPFDGMFDYKPEFWEGVRGGSDKLSSKFSGFLHGMAPHDKMFNSGKALTDYMMAVDGIAGGISVVKNITKLISGGLKIAGNSVAKLEETFGVFGSSKREMAIESNISNSVGKAGREIDDILDTSKVDEDIVSTGKSGEIGKTIESDTNKLKNNNLEDIPNSTKDETGKVNQVDEGGRKASEINQLLKDAANKKTLEILESQSKTSAGPCLSEIYDPLTEKIAYGQNFKTSATGKEQYYQWLENDADPLIKNLVSNYEAKIKNGEIILSEVADYRLAAHSEIVALDEILKNRRALGLPVDETTLSELYLQNIDLTKAYKTGEIVPKIRCEHCRYLTDGINILNHD